MKKYIISIIAAFGVSFLSFSAPVADGDDVIIIEVTEHTGPVARPGRSSSNIECLYYPSLQTAYLSFYADYSSVEVVVSNITSGTSNTYHHSGIGTCPVVVSQEGLTTIDIYTEGGRYYQALIMAINSND